MSRESSDEPQESLYPTGYAICPYHPADLPLSFDRVDWVAKRLEHYERVFAAPPTKQTIEKVAAAFAAGGTQLATDEEACVAVALLEGRFPRPVAELSFPAGEWKETFKPYRDKWMTKLLESKQAVAHSLSGGFGGVKGRGWFQFGHLAPEAIAKLKKFRQLEADRRAVEAQREQDQQERERAAEKPLLVDAYGGAPRTPPVESPGLFVSHKSAASGLILPQGMERERLHEEWQARDRDRKKHKLAHDAYDADLLECCGMISKLCSALVAADQGKHGLVFIPTFIHVFSDPDPSDEAMALRR